MQAVHRILAIVVLVVAAAFTLGAFGAMWRGGSRPWLEWARKTVVALIGLEAVAGVVLYAAGHRPEESLHLLYAVAALVALPFGSLFASEAPPRPRAAVLGFAGILTLGIVFRSFATG
jgi:heme A synthase